MRCSAVLSDCGRYRYQLIRSWSGEDGDGTHNPSLVWIMLNPSTADASRDDATIRRCIGFSLNWGFGGIEVYNLFAYRATCPNNLFSAKDPVGPDNDKWLAAIPHEREVLVAYGKLPLRFAAREKQVLMGLGSRDVRCLGMTLTGFPRHPVRLPYSTKREEMLLPTPPAPGAGGPE